MALIVAVLAPVTILGLLVVVGVDVGIAVCVMFASVLAVTTAFDVGWLLRARHRTRGREGQ